MDRPLVAVVERRLYAAAQVIGVAAQGRRAALVYPDTVTPSSMAVRRARRCHPGVITDFAHCEPLLLSRPSRSPCFGMVNETGNLSACATAASGIAAEADIVENTKITIFVAPFPSSWATNR